LERICHIRGNITQINGSKLDPPEINFSQRALAKTAKKRQAHKETMILNLNYAVCIENRDEKRRIKNYGLADSVFLGYFAR